MVTLRLFFLHLCTQAHTGDPQSFADPAVYETDAEVQIDHKGKVPIMGTIPLVILLPFALDAECPCLLNRAGINRNLYF